MHHMHPVKIKSLNWLAQDFEKLLPNGPLSDAYLKMLDAHGFLEHGGSIGGSWLTKEGKDLLDLLNSYPLEDAMNEK